MHSQAHEVNEETELCSVHKGHFLFLSGNIKTDLSEVNSGSFAS